MEFAAKIKRPHALAVLALLFLAFSCKSPPPPPPDPIIIFHDPLVLQEVAPIPRAVVAVQQAAAVVEYEPVYSTFRIIEVSEVNGVQRYFLVRMGADRTGIAVGVTGDIGEDSAFQRIIGNYRIIELHDDFIRCEIIELTYRIGTNAYMRVQIGEVIKGTTTPR
ncbi:MAG: hypothetical protein LBI14_00345 [Treponema sp.]|jgi:hypothetical protein|nr:hypothetical protein [Treponema sp.]